jgi:hypothetical protein
LISGLIKITRSTDKLNTSKFEKISINDQHSTSTESTVISEKFSNQHHPKVEESFGKVGSLQAFVKSEGPVENFSSNLFSKDEVHKIGILDLRILNLDRNASNILVQKSGSSYKLIPIDHGLSIPDSLEV